MCLPSDRRYCRRVLPVDWWASRSPGHHYKGARHRFSLSKSHLSTFATSPVPHAEIRSLTDGANGLAMVLGARCEPSSRGGGGHKRLKARICDRSRTPESMQTTKSPLAGILAVPGSAPINRGSIGTPTRQLATVSSTTTEASGGQYAACC